MKAWTLTINGWPPSVNSMYVTDRNGRKHLRPSVTAFRKLVRGEVLLARKEGTLPKEAIQNSVGVRLLFAPPDRRGHGLEGLHNLHKTLFDALTQAKILRDDRLVTRIDSTLLDRKIKGGQVTLEIWALNRHISSASSAADLS